MYSVLLRDVQHARCHKKKAEVHPLVTLTMSHSATRLSFSEGIVDLKSAAGLFRPVVFRPYLATGLALKI